MAELGVLIQFSSDKLHITFRSLQVRGNRTVFVKIKLSPGKHEELRTRSINTRDNITFDETFTFFISKERLVKKSLNVELFGYSRSGEEESLGFQETRFSSLNLSEACESVWELKPVQHQIINKNEGLENSFIDYVPNDRPTPTTRFVPTLSTEKLSNDNEKKSEVVDNINSLINIEEGEPKEEEHFDIGFDTSDSSDSDVSIIDGNEKSDMQSLNMRLQNVIKMNQRIEGVNEKLALDQTTINISKDFIELNSLLVSLESQISAVARDNETLDSKIGSAEEKIQARMNQQDILENKIFNQKNMLDNLGFQVESQQKKNEEKQNQVSENREELEVLEKELVELRLQQHQRHQQHQHRGSHEREDHASHKNERKRREYMEEIDPQIYSKFIDEEVEKLGENIDKLNIEVLHKHQTFVNKEEQLERQLQELTENNRDLENSLEECRREEKFLKDFVKGLLEEKVGLVLRTQDTMMDSITEKQIHNATIQAMDDMRVYLQQEMELLKKNLEFDVSLEPAMDKERFYDIVHSQLSALQTNPDLDILNRLFSDKHK